MRFGVLAGTSVGSARDGFSVREIYAGLQGAELGFAADAIAQGVEVRYRRVYQFVLKVRRAIVMFKDDSIQLLDRGVAVDATDLGARCENWCGWLPRLTQRVPPH